MDIKEFLDWITKFDKVMECMGIKEKKMVKTSDKYTIKKEVTTYYIMDVYEKNDE